jgi:hypothetical protein
MGLELPGELTEPLSWIGLIWPQADEDKLFENGTKWAEFGFSLATIAAAADTSAEQVWTSGEAGADEAVTAFKTWWAAEDGPQRRLQDDAQAAEIIGGALVVFAGLTIALKIAFIVQLITLMIEVAQAIATAFVTFGATTAEIPGFIAATRVICRQLIKQVVEHIQTVIREILEKAKNLFKLVESKFGRKAAEDLAKDFEKLGPLRLKSLEREYLGEADALNPNRHFAPRTVHYMSEAERADYRLTVRDGKLYDAEGNLFHTASGSTVHFGGGGRAMFVMDEQGNVYASTVQEVGRLHHSSFLAGAPVSGAGEIEVVDGVLTRISSRSGHYRPPPELQDQVLGVLGTRGVDITNVIREAGF